MNRRGQWDIFCKVIDNFGDIGVCWRLAADLAGRGNTVRLWIDDACALGWMAPAGCEGVRVLPWTATLDLAAAGFDQRPPDVLIEAFGCEVAPEFIAACAYQSRAGGLKPIWINVEYLSAEPYARRCHGLPSPVQSGPAAGWLKWFFYPGFAETSGGLLREPDLALRQAAFDRGAWLAAHAISSTEDTLVSLFCYEPRLLMDLLSRFAERGLGGEPVRLLVTAGRAEKAVKAFFDDKNALPGNGTGRKQLSISYLPPLAQMDFDHLLWSCDLNFVRGEDSLVRALWAAKPFIWQAYPQDDGVHQGKLQAFLDAMDAPLLLRQFHSVWNARQPAPVVQLPVPDLPAWGAWALAARSRLLAQDDLTTRLLEFVAKKR